MVNTVNKIPSINLPLTNEQGTIHPIWYEYLRSFISSVGDSSSGSTADNTVIAGAGIEGTGAVSTVNVGAGAGIKVNANDIEVDINGQINAQAAVEDEILIIDASNLSQIRKTSLQDVVNLAPGTFPGGNNGAIQYNSNGLLFEGDNNFITDGAGNVDITASVDIVGDLDVDSININGNTISTPDSSTQMVFNVPAGGLNQFLFAQSGAGSSATTAELRGLGASSTLLIRSDNNATSGTSDSMLSFATNAGAAEWTMGLFDVQDDDFVLANGAGLNVSPIFTIDRGDSYFTHNTNLNRKTIATITASTTQTQGNGALTADINQVSVVANTNDTVTLPGAQAGSKSIIINDGANTLQVFPASGDNLGAGVNTATTLAAGLAATFQAYDSTNWKLISNSSTSDPELSAIAGLTSAADKFPYFTGSGTAALADLSSNMRSFLTTPSSANLATLLSDETGSGANVHATSPTLVTPNLGVASATSINFGDEALDKYDEGTWTPSMTFATPGDLSLGGVTATGYYTRKGREVTVHFRYSFVPTYTTASGNFRITGLPFTVNSNLTVVTSIGSTSTSTNVSYPAGLTYCSINPIASQTYCQIIANGSSTANANLTTTNFATGLGYTITGTAIYFI